MPLNTNPQINNIPAMNPAPEASLGQASMQPQVSVDEILEAISHFKEYGDVLKANEKLYEVANSISKIAENVEQLAVNEIGQDYDQHTLKRHMKEIKSYAGDFAKLAQESKSVNFRMNALYEDMGRILERYFDIGTQEDMLISPTGAQAMDPQGMNMEPQHAKMKSPVMEDEEIGPVTTPEEEDDDTEEVLTPERQMLTTRAVIAMLNYLKNKDPELAQRYAKLGVKKLRKAAWLLLR